LTVDLATTDTSTTVDPAVIASTETGADNSAPLSEDAAMEAVWDKLVVSNGAERENGKFVSPDPEKRAAAEAAKETPLEGGEEGNDDASTVSDVPLPANWAGKDALWAKLPADVKTEIAEHQTAQHAKFSDMGRKVAAFEPLNNVGTEVSQYLSAAAQRAGAKYDGPKTPAEGVAYLFNIQRMMDADAPGTLMQIMDTYGVRDKIAAALGVKAGEGAQPDQTARLLSEIADLKRTIASNRFDPAMIEQVVDKKNAASRHDEEVSRLTDPKVKPLYAEIPETRMVFFINEAWDKPWDRTPPRPPCSIMPMPPQSKPTPPYARSLRPRKPPPRTTLPRPRPRNAATASTSNQQLPPRSAPCPKTTRWKRSGASTTHKDSGQWPPPRLYSLSWSRPRSATRQARLPTT
jgi:hypothetical protein